MGDNDERINDAGAESENGSGVVQGGNFIMQIDEQDNKEEKSKYVGESYVVNQGNINEKSTNNKVEYKLSEENNNHKKKQNNKKSKRRILSYVLVAIICINIGAVTAGFATLYLLPGTDFFKNTPLYDVISDNNSESTISTRTSDTSKLVSTSDGLTVSEIYKNVGAAVVGVSTKSVSATSYNGTETISEGMGSGIIINEEGYVLTNYHVISGASQVTIILNTGDEVTAKVVNYDSDSDLAIIKITQDIEMPGVAELGSSADLSVGEDVVAIGNPLGKELLGTVTTGIVSAVNREIDDSGIGYIQTDAAINSGNSGGPLLNSKGQVIGINTAKIGSQGTDVDVDGLGFAIPIDIIKEKIESLSKPALKIGISARDIDAELSEKLQRQAGLNVPIGVYIIEIEEFSPAEKAGLKPEDVIVKFDGQEVKTVSEINKIKAKHNNGDVVKVEIYRDGNTMDLDLTLSEE